MKNILKQRTYECKCGTLTKEYVWENELDETKVKCTDCSKELSSKNLLNQIKPQAVSIRTPTKNR
jgi:hypothetical protein